MTRYALDVSNYDLQDSGSTLLDPARLARIRAAGFEEFIVGSQRPALVAQLIPLARAAGIGVHMVYCSYSGTQFGALIDAIQIARSLDLEYVALDCEQNAEDPPTVAERRAAYHESKQQVINAGLKPVRYTNPSYWRNQMGDIDDDAALWLAFYGETNGSNPSPMTTYHLGGRDVPVAIHQYASVPDLEGRPRDRNYLIAPPWEVVPPTTLADVVAALGGDQAIADWNKRGNSLLLGYAQEQQKLADEIAARVKQAVIKITINGVEVPLT